MPNTETEKFVVVRASGAARPNERPPVRIATEQYHALAIVAAESGKSMSQVASEAIAYALKHLEYVDA